MKVLIAVPRLEMPGGVSNYYRSLRPHLDAEKVFFEIGARPGETGPLAAVFRLMGDFWQFHRKLGKESWDLVHVNPSLVAGSVLRDGLLLLIARAHGRRVLVFWRGWDPALATRIRRHHLLLFRWVYRRAAAFIVLGAEFKAALEGMDLRQRTFVATTVVDESLVRSVAATRAPRVPSTGICNILFLCRLDIDKGLPESIDAFARMQSVWPEITLTVAGDGPARVPAEAEVARRGLKGVRFLGHVRGAEKAAAFREADIYLFPTAFIEGMPNSLLEAMACGLPVITRPVGGIRDFFEDGRMGYVTESRDPAVFATFLERLIGDPALRTQMGDYNRDYARRHFVAAVVVQTLLGIYAEIERQSAAG